MNQEEELKNIIEKKRSKIVIILILIAGVGLLLTSFLPYLPYLFMR